MIKLFDIKENNNHHTFHLAHRVRSFSRLTREVLGLWTREVRAKEVRAKEVRAKEVRAKEVRANGGL